MQRWRFGISLMALIVLVVLPGWSAAATSGSLAAPAGEREAQNWTWHTETVDATGNVGEYTALVLGNNGRPRISYYGSSDLKYAYHDGTTWIIQTVDSAGDVGLFTSIAHYGAGNIGISYYDATNGDLKYWTGGSAAAVDTTGNVGQYTSLAFANTGRAHISYYDAGNGNLKYAFQTDTGWALVTLDATGDVGRYTALALRPDNNWYNIVYYDVTNGALKYAWVDVYGANMEVVESGVSAGQWTSLDLDTDNWPHVSYISGGGQNLKYAYKDNAGWHFTVVDTGTAGHTALQLDAADQPHITYWKGSTLRYAYFDGAAWHYETVDATGEVGAYNSLALDSSQRPLVSYRDDTNMDLKYAYLCCAADFTLAPQPQCMTQPVQFTDQTRGFGPFTYLWAFGDGGSSNLPNPMHSYATGGVYTAWLTATASCGVDTVSATVVISSTPQASYTFAPEPICVGTTVVQFTNTTVTSPTTTYQWAFDDGQFSALEHPTHTFAAPALYDVTLIATNGCGLDVATEVVQAHGAPELTVSWTPQPPEVGNVVTFTAQASSTLPVLAYAWDFGDGSQGTGPMVQHTYAATGTYAVVLTGTNECAGGIVQDAVTVICNPVTATMFTWSPVTPTVGWPAIFTATAEGTAPVVYAWDFGDGQTGAGPVAQHTYATTGTYSVVLTTTNYCGQETVAHELVVVARPVAAFASNSPVCLGAAMTFTNTSSGAEPLIYGWSFGDGATSTATNPLHAYAEDGPYTVQLTASNPYGADSVTGTVEVWSAPANADFTVDPAWPFPGGIVTFTATADGYPAPAYSWDLGDGYTATGQLITHTYALTGVYTVLLAARGSCGTVTATQDLYVAFCTGPSGLDMAHSTPLLARERAFFTATLAAGSEPLTYAWDLGDGSPPIYGPAVVSHTYAAGGVFTISVAAWNDCGTVGPLPFPVQVEQTTYYVYLPIVYKAYYGGDQYEPDNTSAQAKPLLLATAQVHDFAPENDVDWVYVTIATAGTYHLRTFNLGGGADTRLFLYDSGGNLVANNDDCPGGQPPDHLASCVTVALAPGRYDLKVDQSPGTPGGMKWGPTVVYTLEATQQ